MAWAAAGVVLLAVAITIVAVAYAGPSVLRASRDGRASLTSARDAFLKRDAVAARRHFDEAASAFRSAETRLGSPALAPSRLIPILNTHVRVAHALGKVGARAAEVGLSATNALEQLPERELRLVDGRIDLLTVRQAFAAFGSSSQAVEEIDAELDGMPSGWVYRSLARARREALDLLPTAVDGLRKGRAALEAMPSLLAENGQKRYLIAFSNLSELRGAGGFIGFVTLLEANNGDLDLADVSGRPTELFPPPAEAGVSFPDWFPEYFRTQGGIFQNINLTTDFPTVGRLVVETAASSIGSLDGVIGVDPIGIAAILRLTGPISVPTWPQPITPENVSRVAQHDVYLQIEDENGRQEFFTQLVRTAFDRLVSTDVRLRPETIGSFDTEVRSGHFRMYSVHPDDQSVFEQLGLSGHVDRAKSANDVLSVVSQNATGNKGDWFLERDISYRVHLDPDASIATGELIATLRNEAPATGLPDYVIGSPVGGLSPGVNRQIVMLVRRQTDSALEIGVDGRKVVPQRGAESSLRAYRTTVEIPPRSSAELKFTSSVSEAFSRSGDERIFRLHVLPQPVAHPDHYDIVIDAPKGWDARGATRFEGDLTEDLAFEVHLSRTRRGWLVEKVFREPWRAARALWARIF